MLGESLSAIERIPMRQFKKSHLPSLLREEMYNRVSVCGARQFKQATNNALALARQCTFGRRLCEAPVVLCDSWTTGIRHLMHGSLIMVSAEMWRLPAQEYAGVLARLLARRVLYSQLKRKRLFIDENIESAASAVEAATLDDLHVSESAKHAALQRARVSVRPLLARARRQRIQRRCWKSLTRAVRTGAVLDGSLLRRNATEASRVGIRIVGSRRFVNATCHALDSLANGSAIYISKLCEQIREIREVRWARENLSVKGTRRDQMRVLWAEVRKLHPVFYGALLAWLATSEWAREQVDDATFAAKFDTPKCEWQFVYQVAKDLQAPNDLLDYILDEYDRSSVIT